MGNAPFTQNILLDDEKFESAVNQFSALSEDMKKLRNDISKLLKELENGFDTPAGRKFVRSCRKGLLKPMDDQAAVIKHVSDNLNMARNRYESVFTEYRALNNMINQH